MYALESSWVILLACLAAVGAFMTIRRRSRQPSHRPDVGNSSLPPISPEEAQRVFAEARGAAMQRAMGRAQPQNPYPPGTRAHILWETEFGTVLIDLTP
ncbi:MAG: hypothetical protein ABIT82_00950 [Ramlibacter sp.]